MDLKLAHIFKKVNLANEEEGSALLYDDDF